MTRSLFRLTAVLVVAGGIVLGGAGSAIAKDGLKVQIEDQCDPVTFNAAIGPGTCVEDSGVTFRAFISALTNSTTTPKSARGWRFDPATATVQAGRRIEAENDGGETHSFTEVPAFGPGVASSLNVLSLGVADTTPPLPELAAAQLIPAGEKVRLRDGLTPGVHRFQCAIHPWMRTVITAVAARLDHG